MKLWEDKAHSPEIAKEFTGNFQIVCVIPKNNGQNNNLTEKRGMISGSKYNYLANEQV